MTTENKLSTTQIEVLKTAAERPDGNIEPLPAQLRGGARTKVIEGLLARDLITQTSSPDHVGYVLTEAGYAAVGCIRNASATVAPDPEIEAEVAALEATWAQEGSPDNTVAKPHTREHSKQASVIALLRRPEGASVSQICEATGWQPHTVRGTFAGAFKKKLGLTLTSEKPEGGERVYRIIEPAASGNGL